MTSVSGYMAVAAAQVVSCQLVTTDAQP